MCVYKPKRPDTSKPFFVGALTVKPQTFGNRPTEIDEMSEPPSPPTLLGALPEAPPPKIVEAAVSPPVVYSANAPVYP